MKRRTFLKGALASGVVAAAAGAGLLQPTEVLAGQWPAGAFKAGNKIDVVLRKLFGTSNMTASKAIKIGTSIQADDSAVVLVTASQADGSAVVPVTVSTTLKADSIAILVAKNSNALAASVDLSGVATGYFRARLKMDKTSYVYAVVKSSDKLYSAKRKFNITVGGCG